MSPLTWGMFSWYNIERNIENGRYPDSPSGKGDI